MDKYVNIETLTDIIEEEYHKQYGEAANREFCETVARCVVEYFKRMALLAILDRLGTKEA